VSVPRARKARPAAPAIVRPFARALALLAAFTPRDRWLGGRELAARCGLPPSSASRIAHSLVQLGYLHVEPVTHEYRLAAAVLALGYGAVANSSVQQSARGHMKAFADQQKLHVILSARARLDLIVLHAYSGAHSPLKLSLHAGMRLGIASSPLGWALLAALPELERYYLLENIERRAPLEQARLRSRLTRAMTQVQNHGFCSSLGEWDPDLAIIAAAFLIEGHAPLVLACVGASAQITRPRVERELGPRLLAVASAIQREGGGE
jgi:DNA-binding IclR family transcriptional regulator